MWVAQEVALASKATLFCGSMSLDCKIIELIFGRLKKYLQLIMQSVNMMGTESTTRKLFRHAVEATGYLAFIDDLKRFLLHEPESMLYPMLMAAYHRDSTNPRDLVFALLGLLRKNSHGDDRIKPDYHMSAEEVYIKVTVHFLRTRHNLDMLSTVSQGFTDGLRCNSKCLWNLPSWVPNWQIPLYTTLLNQGRAIPEFHPQLFHAH